MSSERVPLSWRNPILPPHPYGGWDSRHFYRRNYLKFLPSDRAASILELGVGDGSFLTFLHDLGYDATYGVDISKECVDNLRAAGVCREVALDDASGFLTKTAHEYDVIFMKDVLEHIDPTEVVTLLGLAHQRLAAGGVLVIKTLNASNPLCLQVRYNDLTHRTGFTETSLAQGLALAGFRRFRFFAERSPIVKDHALSQLLKTPPRLLWRLATYSAEVGLRFAYVLFGRRPPTIVAPGIVGVAWRTAKPTPGQ